MSITSLKTIANDCFQINGATGATARVESYGASPGLSLSAAPGINANGPDTPGF